MIPPPEPGTIYIIDDDLSFLKSISRFLRASGYTVQSFESAEEFIQQLAPEMAGCVLSDLQMPGLNGLELQAALNKSANPLPVVFISAQLDIPKTVQAMRGGAEDFITKHSSKEELLDAIRRALERGAQERKDRERVKKIRARFEMLSGRELEVLEQVVRGGMNKQISANLGIALRTVKLHRTNLTRKLQVQSAPELTRLAEELGLFTRDKSP